MTTPPAQSVPPASVVDHAVCMANKNRKLAVSGITARSNRIVAVWLFVLAGLVLAMVLVGGATRLTDSGLSITEWRPVTGAVPPMSETAWLEEMEKYRQIPEYQEINKGMSLAEFKVIYWWEWGHRFLGRLVGIAFAIPFVVFLVKGWLSGPVIALSLVAFALGGMQGAIGWWMVSSGLTERTDVSQYRLATHLGVATFIFGYLLWLGRKVWPPSSRYDAGPTIFRFSAAVLVILVFLQIILGAFVAGIDAGLASDTWPLMYGQFIPSGLWPLDPRWLSAFEDPATVQFNHRMFGYLVAIAIVIHAIAVFRADDMHRHHGLALLLVGLVLFQMVLGILTLWSYVHISAALAHQAGAMVLLAATIIHWDRLGSRTPDRALAQV